MSAKPNVGGRNGRVVLAMIAALLCAAATPGDIGGCGQAPDDEDPLSFFPTLEYADCSACMRCGIGTKTCGVACVGGGDVPYEFADGCAPLVHDAEVCLRRLEEAGCGEYKSYVADDASGNAVPLASRPRPTECNFCPAR